MIIDSKKILSSAFVNDWRLFWSITSLVSLSIVLTMASVDLSRAENISYMIQYTVRWSVPWLYLAFIASSLQIVRRTIFTRWLVRNRKYFGLCFASAMAWQLLFIVCLLVLHSPYYSAEVYNLSDTIEGVGGYLLLSAMVVTSFPFGRRRLSAVQWRYLHKFGIYYLWAYAWSVYWYELFYYSSTLHIIDYSFYWIGFAAWGLRLWAWSKKRIKKTSNLGNVGSKAAL
ncbi:MAG: hypothetical protein ACJ04O_10075 [Cellvibrionales bacterium]